jgi:hypothetical protein
LPTFHWSGRSKCSTGNFSLFFLYLFAHKFVSLFPSFHSHLVTSPAMIEWLHSYNVLKQYLEIGKLISTPTIDEALSYEGFSELLYTLDFWKQVKGCFSLSNLIVVTVWHVFYGRHCLTIGEHVLMMQIDSTLCSNSPSSINEFLEYDWIGAPWKHTHIASNAGNGGNPLDPMDKQNKQTKQSVICCGACGPQDFHCKKDPSSWKLSPNVPFLIQHGKTIGLPIALMPWLRVMGLLSS